ncbi:unnamed protein product [Protopolystoma xenopodis]|uniref:Uncharacterized protein n=1 Tax=Protopolystoma xenopodis TaxID=117903 RepID=A0A448X7K7_9PLAT|nr:unnamed protein product [Protopolystoma xenopodis]
MPHLRSGTSGTAACGACLQAVPLSQSSNLVPPPPSAKGADTAHHSGHQADDFKAQTSMTSRVVKPLRNGHANLTQPHPTCRSEWTAYKEWDQNSC